jgi:hypothetical protein
VLLASQERQQGCPAFTSIVLNLSHQVDLDPQSSAAWNSRAPKGDFVPLFCFIELIPIVIFFQCFNHTPASRRVNISPAVFLIAAMISPATVVSVKRIRSVS